MRRALPRSLPLSAGALTRLQAGRSAPPDASHAGLSDSSLDTPPGCPTGPQIQSACEDTRCHPHRLSSSWCLCPPSFTHPLPASLSLHRHSHPASVLWSLTGVPPSSPVCPMLTVASLVQPHLPLHHGSSCLQALRLQPRLPRPSGGLLKAKMVPSSLQGHLCRPAV